MPSVRYYNQTAPFWDFIANLESAGTEHPFFAAFNPESRQGRDRCRSQHHGPPHHDGPPSAGHEGHDGPPPSGPPPPGLESPGGPPQHSPHDRGGWGGHGRRGGHGGHRNGHHHGGPPFGGWPTGEFDMSKIADFLGSQLGFGGSASTTDKGTAASAGASKDFEPAADVFDTEDAYIVHISLPGAKKEDVGVNWDADKSELSVAGVIYRPGSEEFLKTLALDERKVGVFERKVRLGSRASPAQVDVDNISAKMEDGILMVTIPKEDKDFVDVKKVDIE